MTAFQMSSGFGGESESFEVPVRPVNPVRDRPLGTFGCAAPKVRQKAWWDV